LKAESGGRSTIVFVLDGEEDGMPNVEKQLFDMCLPLKDKGQIKSDSEYGDETVDRELSQDIKLYCCTDDQGTLRVTEVKVGPLLQGDLNSGVH
jgi:hypothetical protein